MKICMQGRQGETQLQKIKQKKNQKKHFWNTIIKQTNLEFQLQNFSNAMSKDNSEFVNLKSVKTNC